MTDLTDSSIPLSIVRIGLLGATGKMGSAVRSVLKSNFTNAAVLSAEVSRGGHVEQLLGADVVIEFSTPDAMYLLAKSALRLSGEGHLPAFIVGSRGWNEKQLATLSLLAKRTLVFHCDESLPGVVALVEALRKDSPAIKNGDFRIMMNEAKVTDVRIGTSLPVSALSADDIVVERKGDKITVVHQTKNQPLFARGAIEAALWLSKKQKNAFGGVVLSSDAFFKDALTS